MARLLPALSRKHKARIAVRRTLAACGAVVALLCAASSGQGQPLTLDLDGDGRLDLLLVDPTTPPGFVVAEAQGQSALAAAKPAQTALHPPHLIICDWNADDLPDVLTFRAGEPPALWINRGGKQFASGGRLKREASMLWQSVALADFTNSPYPSLLGKTDSLTLVLVERRDAESSDYLTWRMPEPGPVRVRDVDGDGRLDVLAGSYVRLRTVAGWSKEWEPLASFPERKTVRLRLVGPPENPKSIGARVTIFTPVGRQTHWLYPPAWNILDPTFAFTVPDDTQHASANTGFFVRWSDGSYAMSAENIRPGSYELRAIPAEVDDAERKPADSPSHVRWHITPPTRASSGEFWKVVRTGTVSDPDPVTVDPTGRWIDWRSDQPLRPGEECILSYAGNPVSTRFVPGLPSVLLPIPVARDSSATADEVVIADGDGDGTADIIARRASPDAGTFDVQPFSITTFPTAVPAARFLPERSGHRMWWQIVNAALAKGSEADGGEPEVVWSEGGPPARIAGWRHIVRDLTGDGRPDLVAVSPEGVAEVYQGTDGRPSGYHLVGGTARIGPVGPGERTSLSIANPTGEPLSITAIDAPADIRIGQLGFPAVIAPHEALAVPIIVAEHRHEDFTTHLTVASENVYQGVTDMPVRVTIGVPADAPFLRISSDLGVVERDSLERGIVSVPWVRLPPASGTVVSIHTGEGYATLTAMPTGGDTVRFDVRFTALAVGKVSLSYPLRRGEVVLTATAVDTIPPPPTRPTVSVRHDSVEVRWPAVDVADIDHYELLRIENGASTRWVTNLDTMRLDRGLGEGRTRGYLVRTVDVSGNAGVSDTVFATRPDETPPAISLVDPLPNAHNVRLHQPVTILIADSLTGIAPDSVRMWIGEQLVPPERLNIRRERYRWDLTYRPESWPMNAQVRLTVAAADSAHPPNVRRWTGSFVTVADTVVPVLRLIGAPPMLGEGGVVRAEVSMPPDRELIAADLILRPAGRSQAETLAGTVRGRQIEVDIPPTLSPASGLFYRWKLRTDRRAYIWPDDSTRLWRSWVFRPSGEASFWPRSGSHGSGRALLASPIAPDEGDALALLRADLLHRPNITRLYEFDAARQKWIGQDRIGPVGVGDAVFMAWEDVAPVMQTSAGHTVALDSAQTITLQPRWNLVGQPFPYPISWRRVREANPELSLSGVWVERDALSLAEVWRAWEGGWIYLASTRPEQLTIPAGDTVLVGESPASRPSARTMPAWLAASEELQAQTQMLLTVTARKKSREVRDIALGWNAQASDTYDRLDIPVPPTPDSVLFVRFPHRDWEENPGNYAVDLRKPGEGSVWRLAVDSQGSSPVVLDFNFAVPPPPGVTADLIDLVTRDSVRLASPTTTYTLRDMARFPVRELAIVVGDEQFRASLERADALAPSTLNLYQNYPNPFNSETIITYSLPAENDGESRLRVTIYNMLGQQVRVLYDGPATAGVHTLTWDARDDQGGTISSGLYFCELTWGRQRRFQRLIYLR